MTFWGTFDKARKTMTMTGEGPGMDGKLQKMKSVSVHKSADQMTFKMYTIDGGKESLMMTIEYTRKK